MSFNMNLRGGSGASSPSQTGNIIPKGFKQGQMNQFTPQQHELFSRLFGQVGGDSYLSKLAGGSQEGFDEMEAPAMRQFQELQGGLASRFSGMGSGARKSSGFQNSSTQATQDFASQLQSQRQGYQRQALQDLMSMSGQLLGQRPYEQFMVPKQMGFGKQLALGLAGGIGQAGGAWGLSKLFGGNNGTDSTG